MISLDKDGYFRRDAGVFVPFGVNYWPGSTGTALWREWPAEEIQRDLDTVVRLGMNTVRFFLLWQDFEPEIGQYDPVCFDRLTTFVGWCAERNILAHPAVFVGWMSASTFFPAWKEGRNLYTDPVVRERSVLFASRVAEVLSPQQSHLLAIDIGNEIGCIGDSHRAASSAVAEWCADICAVLKAACPDTLVISGLDSTPIHTNTGWRLTDQPGCDLYSAHGYPVPNWNVVRFDGMSDPLAQAILPAYARILRAYGPTFAQEFGTIATGSVVQQETYLRGLLPALWDAGANGFLWWCLKDMSETAPPYDLVPFECRLGLVNDDGEVKPGLGYLLEFGHSLTTRPPASPSGKPMIGIYIPNDYYGSKSKPAVLAPRFIIADYLLRRAGYDTRFVRGDSPMQNHLASVDALLVVGASLPPVEVAYLAEWVQTGGKLLWHGIEATRWGPTVSRLIGADMADLRTGRSLLADVFGENWEFTAWHDGTWVVPEATTATVLAHDSEQGTPLVLHNRLGCGSVVCTMPLIEDGILAIAENRAARDRWAQWYDGVLRVALAPTA